VICGIERRKNTAVKFAPRVIWRQLEDQSDRLPAAFRTAIDADVGRASKKLGLRSVLPLERSRNHLSPYRLFKMQWPDATKASLFKAVALVCR